MKKFALGIITVFSFVVLIKLAFCWITGKGLRHKKQQPEQKERPGEKSKELLAPTILLVEAVVQNVEPQQQADKVETQPPQFIMIEPVSPVKQTKDKNIAVVNDSQPEEELKQLTEVDDRQFKALTG